jgi:magnesium chelatase subunit H
MTQYSNENSGLLAKNDKQGNESRPDYRGSINVDGREYWLSAWIKTGRDGTKLAGQKYMSLSVQPKGDWGTPAAAPFPAPAPAAAPAPRMTQDQRDAMAIRERAQQERQAAAVASQRAYHVEAWWCFKDALGRLEAQPRVVRTAIEFALGKHHTKTLQDLKALVGRWENAEHAERAVLATSIQEAAAGIDIAEATPAWSAASNAEIEQLAVRIAEIEGALIPSGLHTVGVPPDAAERTDLLLAIAEGRGEAPPRAAVEAMVAGVAPENALGQAGKKSRTLLATMNELREIDASLARDHEVDAILSALDARYIRPAAGGDIVRNPSVLPTGRNMHGFDPFRIPSALAMHDGAMQADRLLAQHAQRSGGVMPESIAMVLWGSDNLKSEGGPIAQALALIGARPRFDSYGRLCGAALIPLSELKRARIDVVMTLSGIFRDLLALQVRMLAEAAYLAAAADEPLEHNYVRKHALALQAAHGCDLETAALRVFSNADGAYGANVNQLIDSSAWNEEEELADAFESRKCFAYGRTGGAVRQSKMLQSILKGVDFTYQNLESVELGVTSIDHYVDALGGMSRAIQRARGSATPVYIGDQTQGEGKVRTLAEQVSLETHTRTLNPKWYEGLLKHGYEGVRQIEAQVTNTMGWSATTGQVEPWIYQRISETYVLDDVMRKRLTSLNPKASARMANRLLEAHERKYWRPDDSTLNALRNASDELEDQLEGISAPAA